MTRTVVMVALAVALTAPGCSDEPDFGPYEKMVVHGPAAAGDEAPRFDVATFRQSVDGRTAACFGVRIADEPGNLSGTCIRPGHVPELDDHAFAETSASGPIASGIVTLDAAAVVAHLRDGSTIEMTPYRHPDLRAGVFAFSIREETNFMTLEAVDSAGAVLGSFDG